MPLEFIPANRISVPAAVGTRGPGIRIEAAVGDRVGCPAAVALEANWHVADSTANDRERAAGD